MGYLLCTIRVRLRRTTQLREQPPGASDAEEALDDVVAGAMGLRRKIASGVVSPDNARRALAELRQRHRVIAGHVPSIKVAHDGAVKTIEDPAAKIIELTSKFGSLQQ